MFMTERSRTRLPSRLRKQWGLIPLLLAGGVISIVAFDGSEPTLSARNPPSQEERRYWLENMIVHHQFTVEEVVLATGWSTKEARQAVESFRSDVRETVDPCPGPALRVLPYPGGRHPRIGFLEGAIDPQRETKVSIFAPWDLRSYVVMDVPEAIFSNLGLTYLAHTHLPTIWDSEGLKLEPLEWERRANGVLAMERQLPNGISFGSRVVPRLAGVAFEQWLRNGTEETLTDLHVQNCLMLKMARGFNQQTNQVIQSQEPYTAIRSPGSDRWIITAFEPCRRLWANPDVPCIHSDPQFPDCAPGKTTRIRGWLSFYEGADVVAEFKRLDKTGWRGLEVARTN